MKKILIFTLVFLAGSLFSENWGGWYFSFHLQPVSVSGELIAPDGGQKVDLEGDREGKVFVSDEYFLESSRYRYQPMNTGHSMLIKWVKGSTGNLYKGSAKDPTGNQVEFLLSLLTNTQFEIKSTNSDGRTMVEKGVLKTDGKIYVKGVMRLKDGTVFLTSSYVLSRKKEGVLEKGKGKGLQKKSSGRTGESGAKE